MKYILGLLIVITMVACSTREKGAVLEKGSENYEMAQLFTEKVPEFNPDDNIVVLSTRDFDVTVGDVIDRMRSRFGNKVESIAQSPRSSIIRLYKELAQSVAYSKILKNVADEEGIAVTEAHIDSILEIQYQRAGGEEKYLNFLFANGATIETLRRDIRTSEIERMYFEKRRMERNPLRQSEIDSAMNGDRYVTVRHILLMFRATTDSAKQVIRKKMEGILEKAKAGEDFAKLAREYSEDPGSKNNGGLLEAEKGQLVPSFEKVAFSIPIGEISDIVETQYGYHILKVVERKKEDRPREQVINYLKEKRKRLSRQNVYDKLTKDHNFEYVQLDAK
jgi:parvulin-like peptidyl-prolyl isomerase